MAMLDHGMLFNSLLGKALLPFDGHAEMELDTNSINRLPTVVHRSSGQRISNHDLMWNVTLNLYVYADGENVWEIVNHLDDEIRAWGLPGRGVVPDVGSIIGVDQEFMALTPMVAASDAAMKNKTTHQWQGSWAFNVQQYP